MIKAIRVSCEYDVWLIKFCDGTVLTEETDEIIVRLARPHEVEWELRTSFDENIAERMYDYLIEAHSIEAGVATDSPEVIEVFNDLWDEGSQL